MSPAPSTFIIVYVFATGECTGSTTHGLFPVFPFVCFKFVFDYVSSSRIFLVLNSTDTGRMYKHSVSQSEVHINSAALYEEHDYSIIQAFFCSSIH